MASLAGLALLKLFAWRDRGLEDTRDATDLVMLCRHYAEAGNLDRIYEEALPALQAVGFDVELAGAWLLGKDTAATASPQTCEQLKALRSSEDAGTYAKQLLDQFTRGFSSPTVA